MVRVRACSLECSPNVVAGAQCFTRPKGASLALVLAGVLLYTRSARRGLSTDECDSPAEGVVVPEHGRKEDAAWRLATWRWLRR